MGGGAAQVEVGGAGEEEGAGTVPVHVDIFLFGEGGDALEVSEGDVGAILAADRWDSDSERRRGSFRK